MTLSTTTTKVIAAGNDSGTVFSFSPVPITVSTDLVVTHVVDSTGVETTLTEGTGSSNYSVSVTTYPGTGSIVYPADQVTPLPTGESLVMQRVLPLTQSTSLQNQGGYLPKNQEDVYDRLTMIDQQLDAVNDRTLRLKVSDTATDIDVARTASKYLRWNAAADGIDAVAVEITTITASASDVAPLDVSQSAAAAGTGSDLAREDHVHLQSTVTVANGGTGSTTAAAARTALGLGTAAVATSGIAATGDLPTVLQVRGAPFSYGTSTGSSNTYALATSPVITSYVGGEIFTFRANHTNTGASTFNVDGVGALGIIKYTVAGGASAQNLVAGDILLSQLVQVVYDVAHNAFFMLSPTPSAFSGGGLVPLDNKSISSAAVQNFTDVIDSSYVTHRFILNDVRVGGTDLGIWMQVYTAAGVQTGATDYLNNSTGTTGAGALTAVSGTTGAANVALNLAGTTWGIGTTAGDNISGIINIYNAANTNVWTTFDYNLNFNRSGVLGRIFGSGAWDTNTAVTGVRFDSTTTAQIDDGDISLYGITQ